MAMISFSLPSPAKLPVKSQPSVSNRINVADRLILRHLNAGDLRGAVSALDLMARDGIRPIDSVTFSSLLKSCIRARDFRLGKLVHARVMEFEIEPDSVLYNSLISLYSKSGDSAKAEDVFVSMGRFGKRDVVSWSAMMACLGNNGRELDAIRLFVEFLELGLVPNDYCYTAVIRACSNSEFVGVGRVILGFLMKTGHFESDVCVGCSLIDMFVKGENSLENAYKVFDKMSELNVVTWTLMITRCMQMGFPREAVRFFLDMVLSGFESDKFTLSSVFSACAELENLSLGKQLHSWAIRSGLADDVECSLVDMYAKCSADSSVDDCRKVFDRMQDHSVMSWTALITGYMQNCNLATEAINLFCEMITQGHVEPNHFTFSSAFKACGNLLDPRVGKQVLGHAFKRGLASNSSVANSVISMFVKSDRMEDARRAFESLSEKNLVSYNTFLDGTCRNLDFEQAFELLNEITERELGVSAFTFASLLSGVASVGSIRKGEQIHSQVLKLGLACNQPVCNALISMYSKCGSIDTASQVFNLMEDRNVISWTSMITGFAKHGFAERVLETFNQMTEEGVKPNEVTYVAILSACSHVGLVSEGWRHFKSMYQDHNIKPKMEHYACMVDLLCRAGLLTDAFEFINKMPFQADVLVWRTFLGACRVHSNTELGKMAARKILELDPNEPAAYIQLSNIYASAGKWEESTEMRKKMKERNLVKEGGCSWIEVGDKVHKFYVGDTSHPNAHKIYDELDRLISEIKRCGYVPDTDLVLHKLEEDDDDDGTKKERLLYQHSEKIAVAFGLISTAKSRPVRVFKNLRVCGDCHNAMKYISSVSGREIVLRDLNRFHHFKGGKCSCNDYW
ncbi:PREDICTED: pentatricopeptide repeat-containing protein At3g49170, chloroplastic isoform X2 [Camelina sativa]|nr:PREDICTED: pentatricopeptide repeat-containing protein At3g49170, chloroplastic isoform X2 [Camelina sativa]